MLAEFRVPNLLAGGPGPLPAVGEDELHELVLLLAARAEVDLGPLAPRLERLLRTTFPEVVLGLLKEDYRGGTPLGGRAFAALWLDVQRKRANDFDELRAALGEVSVELDQLGRRLEGELERGLRKLRTRAILRDERLRAWLADWRALLSADQRAILDAQYELLERIDRMRAAVLASNATSLVDRESFEARTMRDVESPPFLGPLMDEPSLRDALEGRPAGRDEELRTFEDFLDHPSRRVLYWKAMPGAGKTRLCIEASRIAEERGWLALFLEEPEPGRDPARALADALRKRLTGDERLRGARVLLVWDTSARAVDPSHARSIYELRRRGLFFEAGVELRVLVASWPVHARALEDEFKAASDADWLQSAPLDPVGARPDFQELLRGLLPEAQRERVDELVRAAEGNALDCLSAVIELRAGTSIAALGSREGIQSARYRRLLAKALPELASAAGRSLLDALRVLALRQRIRAEDAERALGAESARAFTEALHDLRDRHLIADRDGAFHMTPDRFRIELTRLALADDGTPFSMAFGFEGWKRLVAPWIEPANFDEPLSIAQQALAGQPLLRPVDEFLFARLEGTETIEEDRAIDLAEAWRRAALVSTDPEELRRAQVRVEALLEVHPLPRIAWVAAILWFHATTGEAGPLECEASADRIQRILERNAAFRTPEIVLELAQALFNATVVEPDASRREALADRIESMLSRDAAFRTPEIALELAQALCSATVVEPDASRGEALADRIESLLSRDAAFRTPEIALELVKALANATAVEPDARRCEALADRIESLMSRDAVFRTPEIALRLAKARGVVALARRDRAASERAQEAFRSLAESVEPLRSEIAGFLGWLARMLDDGDWAHPLREVIREFSE